MLIVQTNRLQEVGQFPLDPTVFETKVEEMCHESRNILLNEWLPKCADIFLNLKKFWKQYIPKSEEDAVQIIENFFACANGIMAKQLRRLVLKSLRHFLNMFIKYKVI